MKAASRNILQQRAEEDRRAREEAKRQRREYVAVIASRVRCQPLTHRPFAKLPERIFDAETE